MIIGRLDHKVARIIGCMECSAQLKKYIGPADYRYSDEQKMTEFGRSSISDAFWNFSCSSVLPMTLAAWFICRISSCSLRNTRIRLPSNWSVSCSRR